MAIDPGGTTGVSAGVFPRAGNMKNRIRRGKRMWHGQLDLEHLDMALWGKGVPNAYSEEMAAAMVLFHAWKKFKEQVEPLKPQLIIEGFILGMRPKSMKREGLSPVRIAAALEPIVYLGAPSGMEFTELPLYQLAAEAKGFATDERLREWGLWHVGQEHARDASRHLALRLAKLKK